MPGQRGSERRQRTEAMLVRLYPAEFERLEAEARTAGISRAELARRRLAGRQVIARTDAALIRELRRIGGLTKLALRTRGMAEAGRATLADIRRAIAHLSGPPS